MPLFLVAFLFDIIPATPTFHEKLSYDITGHYEHKLTTTYN